MGADVKQSGEQFGNSAKYSALAGPGGEQEVLLRRARGLFEGSSRPAAGNRRDQADPRSVETRRSAFRAVMLGLRSRSSLKTCSATRSRHRILWNAGRAPSPLGSGRIMLARAIASGPTLYDAGLVPFRLKPADYRAAARISNWIDRCRQTRPMAPTRFCGVIISMLRASGAKIERHRPRLVAFNGKKRRRPRWG